MAALSQILARARDARGRRSGGLPMGFVVGRYFAYVIVGCVVVACAALMRYQGMLADATLWAPDYGSRHASQFLAQARDQGTFSGDEIPSAYWWARVDKRGNVLEADGGAGADVRGVASEVGRAGGDIGVQEMPRYYDLFGLGARTYRWVERPDGAIVVLAWQGLPQYRDRALRDGRPNVVVTLVGGWAAACVALTVAAGLRASWVITRKLRPAVEAAGRIEGADLDSPVGTSNVRQVRALLDAMERMRLALRETLDARWRAEEAQREGMAALAHDLRASLTVARANAELLAEGRLPKEAAREAALAVADASRRMDEGVDRIVEVSRGEAAPPELVPTAAGELLGRVADAGRALAAARGVELGVDLGPLSGSAEKNLAADAPSLERALGDLVANACEHAAGRVTLSARAASGELRVRVADDGAGFSPAALEHGCERFFRDDAARTATPGERHFGLGLFDAAEVVRAHGGALALSNDGGAVAEVTLPLA